MRALGEGTYIDISTVDVDSIVKSLAPELTLRDDGERRGRCPFPDHDDQNPSFAINVAPGDKKGLWNCSCESGTLVKFVMNMTGVSHDKASQMILKNKIKNERGSVKYLEDLIHKWDSAEEFELEEYDLPPVRPAPSLVMKYLTENRNYNREMATQALSGFNLGICVDPTDSPVYNWIIVPVNDTKGYPIMWVAQHPESRRKYNGGKVTGLLFNVEKARNRDWVIVVESFWCAIKVATWGYPVVSTFGARMDKHQAKVIKSHWNTVYLCYDQYDAAGQRAEKKAIGLLTPQLKVKTMTLPSGKDPDKCSYKEFEKAGYTVLGASRDTPKKLKDFQTKYNLGYTFLSDPKGKLAGAFGIKSGARQTVLIAKDGTLTKIYKKVAVAKHAQQVLDEVSKR